MDTLLKKTSNTMRDLIDKKSNIKSNPQQIDDEYKPRYAFIQDKKNEDQQKIVEKYKTGTYE
jgi:conjugal transfer/entry exclusion protein